MIHLFIHSHISHTAFVQPAHSQSLPACDHKLEKVLYVHIGTAFATASFHHVMISALAEVLFAPTFCLLRGCPAGFAQFGPMPEALVPKALTPNPGLCFGDDGAAHAHASRWKLLWVMGWGWPLNTKVVYISFSFDSPVLGLIFF